MPTFTEENHNIEYKIELPKKNEKWLKTVVSFSNTSGGDIIVGVQDGSLEVVGLKESRTALEQRVIEAIHDTVQPSPTVEIVFRSVDEKDIMEIKVARGNEQPYVLKQKGKETIYVRYGSTDHIANENEITEMKLFSKGEQYTSLEYKENGKMVQVTDDDIKRFLETINQRAKLDRYATKSKLLEWKVLTKVFESIYATNGYMLLTNNTFNYAYIRLGAFDGNDKTDLLYEREFRGSIIDQFFDSVQTLEDILNEGYEITVYRDRKLKVPTEVLREIIANAIVHRQYMDESPVWIQLYDDRMEVFSPGPLVSGVSLENMMTTYCKLRNTNVAEVFRHMGIIESWGSGYTRINSSLKKNNFKPVQVDVENGLGVRVTVFYEKIVSQEKNNEDSVLEMLDIFSRKELENILNISEKQARTMIENWKINMEIEQIGSGPSTRYKVKK